MGLLGFSQAISLRLEVSKEGNFLATKYSHITWVIRHLHQQHYCLGDELMLQSGGTFLRLARSSSMYDAIARLSTSQTDAVASAQRAGNKQQKDSPTALIHGEQADIRFHLA